MSTDQCINCTARGDIKACRDLECSHHDTWYARNREAEIRKWRELAERAIEFVPYRNDKDAERLLADLRAAREEV